MPKARHPVALLFASALAPLTLVAALQSSILSDAGRREAEQERTEYPAAHGAVGEHGSYDRGGESLLRRLSGLREGVVGIYAVVLAPFGAARSAAELATAGEPERRPILGSLTPWLAALLGLPVTVLLVWSRARRLAQRKSRPALVQSQKLEAVGHLSGVLVHDFKNLLAIVDACLRQIGRGCDEATRVEIVAEGLGATRRGAALIEQLLSFARDKPLELDCVDIAEVLEGIGELLTRSINRGSKLTTHIDPDARLAYTNATQLEVALINLAVNARDAMPNGGALSISAVLSADGKYVELCVRDTGTGMPPEVAARALDPFFTTKKEGKGTGLGLAQVNSLVQQSGGELLIDSVVGKGTAVTLRLQRCDAKERSRRS
ncbi:MAG: ATP-binding protein [Bauldia sp.]